MGSGLSRIRSLKKLKAWPADLRLEIGVMRGSEESEVEEADATTFTEVTVDFVY